MRRDRDRVRAHGVADRYRDHDHHFTTGQGINDTLYGQITNALANMM